MRNLAPRTSGSDDAFGHATRESRILYPANPAAFSGGSIVTTSHLVQTFHFFSKSLWMMFQGWEFIPFSSSAHRGPYSLVLVAQHGRRQRPQPHGVIGEVLGVASTL